jgi:serine/threonine protein kinase
MNFQENNNWIGKKLKNGRYELLGAIGQGGQGQVYRALDLVTKQE